MFKMMGYLIFVIIILLPLFGQTGLPLHLLAYFVWVWLPRPQKSQGHFQPTDLFTPVKYFSSKCKEYCEGKNATRSHKKRIIL